MNLYESVLLENLAKVQYINQRILSENTGYSLGVINRSLHSLLKNGYLNESFELTAIAKAEINEKSPRNAIILAAGLGMRMAPVNYSSPKALVEAKGERLIDRLINQLHDAGIVDITAVVGFMKDSFEYLIDKGVDIVFNPDYANRNNLHSLAIVSNRIRNTYIVPSDIWLEYNPFSNVELHSWYMVSDKTDANSSVRVNRKNELVCISDMEKGNAMIGVSYLIEPEAGVVRENLNKFDCDERYSSDFWEKTLYFKDRMFLLANVVKSSSVVEINTYEQLREFDSESSHLKSDAINIIKDVFDCDEKDIVDINVLKKGMTNRSFVFSIKGSKYIMRIPGEGTDKLIKRKEEAEVYKTIAKSGLCDDPIYFNSLNGYKITKYLDDVRVCNKDSINDLQRCMSILRKFHNMKLHVEHSFDLYEKIDFYESLWGEDLSIFLDYNETKENVLSLRSFVDSIKKDYCLTHIDAVPDNFLFYRSNMGKEEIQLTDWEYSGMQDPHVDIAMFAIYSIFDKDRCDQLIDIYFENKCDDITRAKIYVYIATCGLLWSNWCEYKRKFGVEFGEYSYRQYRYAKDFYKYATQLISNIQDN